QATGSVVWHDKHGGVGADSPLFHDAGAQQIVYSTIGNGIRAYDADTGAVVWDHADAGIPGGAWSTGDTFWTELVYDGGFIYGQTYNFLGTDAEIVKVDAATGELVWIQDDSETPVSDCPMLLIGGTLYAFGGPFGNVDLTAFDASSGLRLWSENIGGTVFRNYSAAMNDRIYIAQDGFGIRHFALDG